MINRVRDKNYKQNLSGKHPHMKITDMNWGEEPTYTIQCCDTEFPVSVSEYEARCPKCGQTLRVASLRRDWELK